MEHLGASTRVDRSSEIEYSWRNPFTTEFAAVVGHLWHKRLYLLWPISGH